MGEIKCFDLYKLIVGILTTVEFRKGEILELLTTELGEIDYISSFLDFNYTDYYNREMGANIKRFFVSFRDLVDPSSLADIKIRTNMLEKQFSAGALSRRPCLCAERNVHVAAGDLSRRSQLSPGQAQTPLSHPVKQDSEIKTMMESFPKRCAERNVHVSANNQDENESRKVNFDPGIMNLSRLILASTKDNAHRIPLSKGIYAEITLLFQKGDFKPLPWSFIDYQSKEYTEILFKIRTIFKEDLKNY